MQKIVDHYLDTLPELIEFLRPEDFVYLQVHNFPDPDAVASAFGLQHLFKHYGIESRIVFDRDLRGSRLKKMIRDLDIDIQHIDVDGHMNNHHKIILVDGCKGNANVTDLVGDEVAVIDHHLVTSPDDVEFSDIRPDIGACSSIIGSYFLELGVDIPRNVATALMVGIGTDTALLTRGVSEEDLCIYFHCFHRADIDYVMSVLRNSIRYNDLQYFNHLINNLRVIDNMAFCHFQDGCLQNVLAIMATFALSLDEVDLVVLSATNENQVQFSVRSEKTDWNAASLIREALEGIGFGGGHQDMAGGVIPDARQFNRDEIFEKIRYLSEQT